MAEPATDLRDQVVSIIARATLLPVAELRPEARPEDLGIDSLGLVESIFALEESLGIRIPFNAQEPERTAFDTSTIGAIIAGVEALVAARAGSSTA